MALTEIQYGSIARSQVLNDNFNYLEERISEIATNLSQTYATLVALVNSQTSSVTNNLNNEVATLNGEIDTTNTAITNNKKIFDTFTTDIYKKMSPNYKKGVAVTFPVSTAKWTAPNYGIYVTTIFRNQSNTQLYINDVLTAYKHIDSADGASYGEFTIPVAKGDVLYWTNAAGTVATSTFYPYIGCS